MNFKNVGSKLLKMRENNTINCLRNMILTHQRYFKSVQDLMMMKVINKVKIKIIIMIMIILRKKLIVNLI